MSKFQIYQKKSYIDKMIMLFGMY